MVLRSVALCFDLARGIEYLQHTTAPPRQTLIQSVAQIPSDFINYVSTNCNLYSNETFICFVSFLLMVCLVAMKTQGKKYIKMRIYEKNYSLFIKSHLSNPIRLNILNGVLPPFSDDRGNNGAKSIQVTGPDGEGGDKARFEVSKEAAFARRRCSFSGFHRSFQTVRLSGSLSLSLRSLFKIDDFYTFHLILLVSLQVIGKMILVFIGQQIN